MSEVIQFKFRFVDEDGKKRGFLAKNGSIDGSLLTVDGSEIPIATIGKALRRFDHVAVTFTDKNGEANTFVMAVRGSVGKQLHTLINRAASTRHAEARREALVEAGKAERFRSEVCPHCEATVDLSGFEVTPQLYCDFCDKISMLDGSSPKDAQTYQLCGNCGYYSQPKLFTLFYFYFAIVVYGWRSQQVHYCNACMRSEAWKMFFGNLLFIIGVPVAVVQLCRAYFGGSALSGSFKGLDKANALALRGKADKAGKIYMQIAERVGPAAGIHYNHGLALARAGQIAEAIVPLEQALVDCGNYHACAETLYLCYQKNGQPAQADLIKALWAGDDQAIDAALEKIAAVPSV